LDTPKTVAAVSATAQVGEAADEMAETDIDAGELVEGKLTASAVVGSLAAAAAAAEEEVGIAALADPADLLPSRQRASSCRFDLGLALVGGRVVGRNGEDACPSRVTSHMLKSPFLADTDLAQVHMKISGEHQLGVEEDKHMDLEVAVKVEGRRAFETGVVVS
jgi:hypothetical protein